VYIQKINCEKISQFPVRITIKICYKLGNTNLGTVRFEKKSKTAVKHDKLR